MSDRDPDSQQAATAIADAVEDDASFQQAKNPVARVQIVPIKAKCGDATPNKPKLKAEPKLIRVAFKVSRLMEFCTERELQSQTGHSWADWALVVLKELFDNSLDACEESQVAPVVSVDVDRKRGLITIQDNAGGIDLETIESVLDYTIRVSSREAYSSPTRGAQGNALKTILAMSFVLQREGSEANAAIGETIIETRGTRYRIVFGVDHINNQPKITRDFSQSSPITVGTKITVNWPPDWKGWIWGRDEQFKSLARSYSWFNPHLTLRGTFDGETFVDIAATNPTWKKWGPRDPTSPHWYNTSRLQRYLAAHVARDRELGLRRTVNDFLCEFSGLARSSVRRKILNEVGCSHQSLAQFFGVEEVNAKGIAKLLAAMCKYSKPVNPKRLGVIGAEHFKQRFLEAGGHVDTFKYKAFKDNENGIPYVIEMISGNHQSALEKKNKEDRQARRQFVVGANWSVGISNPFRSFGRTGEGLETTLSKLRGDERQPIICAVHLAMAHIQYADRGKSSIVLSGDDVEQPDD